MKRSVLFMAVLVLLMPVSRCLAEDCGSVVVHYHERIPYAHSTGNSVEGLTATPADSAFKKSRVPFEWKNTPSKRQMVIIEENNGCDCAIGWFKNPDREKFAGFTRPLYQDKPQIALARADNAKLHNGMTVDSVLSNPKFILGIKDGYSYGSFLDGKILQHKPVTDGTTGENINMLNKIHAGRFDYFFIAPEEAESLIESSGLPKQDFQYVIFSDMPDGEKRYIMCSRKVRNEIIEKLNSAISENEEK